MTRRCQFDVIHDNALADCYVVGMDDVAVRLGKNVRMLREGRGMTQAQMAKLASIRRFIWSV